MVKAISSLKRFRFPTLLGSLILTAFLTIPHQALSADMGDTHYQAAQPAYSGWVMRLGGGVRFQPAFEGSDSYSVSAVPHISFGKAGGRKQFRASDDGISFSLYKQPFFEAGPLFEFIMPRDVDDDRVALNGLGDVDFAAEPGVFINLYPVDGVRVRAEARRGFGGHEGWLGDFSFDVFSDINQPLRFSAGARLSIASDDFFDNYFAIDAVQSANSGLAQFNTDGGLRSAGIHAQINYDFAPNWTSELFAQYSHLLGDAGDSPLVTLRGSEDQFKIGLNVRRSFNLGHLGF